MMRSLTVKLSLAFVVVGVIGVIVTTLLLSIRTRTEFNRFLSERDQATLVDALSAYYASNGSWDGVQEMLATTEPLNSYSKAVAFADANGAIILPDGNYSTGQIAPQNELNAGIPVIVETQTVGYILVGPSDTAPADTPPPRPPPDAVFLQRMAETAATYSVVAVLFALALGVVLAQMLTRPIRELTMATKAMAGGQLGQRVVVRSHDEIGELARSFNQMSTDLARASQLRKQMTADLAHDLRTPLSILRGYTEGLQDGRLKGNPALYIIMHSEVEHLQRLVEDLRVLSLADAGELPLNRRSVDPSALLERTGLAYIVQAEAQGVALRVEAPEALPSILVDTDRMTQVLNNLVSNALRHTSQGEIVLAASSDGAQVALQVRDTGSGIDAEDLPYIFDRFYRADKSRQRADHISSGLGLAIAKALVESHGGTLTVESQPGDGTTFTITLPVAHEEGNGPLRPMLT